MDGVDRDLTELGIATTADVASSIATQAAADTATYAPLAPDWATGHVFVVGELTVSSGTLYRCKTAHTAGVSFDATKFDSVSGGDFDAAGSAASAQAAAIAASAQRASNLSDLANAATARTNLGVSSTQLAADPLLARPSPAYNLPPGALLRFRAALARARAGTGDCRLGFWGDSISAGQGATNRVTDVWGVRAAKALAARTGLSCRRGIIPVFPDTSATTTKDPQWVATGGWGGNGVAMGYGNAGAREVAGSANTLTFTPTDDSGTQIQVDSFIVYAYAGGTSGSFQVSIDGGAYSTVTNSGSLGYNAYTVSAGTRGLHTLTILPPAAGNQPYIWGAEGVDSQTRGIRYFCTGTSGTVTPSTLAADVKVGWSSLAFDLVLPAWSINDYQNQTVVATFQSNAAAFMAIPATLTKPADCLWVSTGWDNNSLTIPQQNYFDALAAAAVSAGVPLVQYERVQGSWALANGAPVSSMTDALHPNQTGHALLGNTVATVLAQL